MSHTPGPWKHEENITGNGDWVWAVKAVSETELGVIASLNRTPNGFWSIDPVTRQSIQEKEEANARLIAAAPDLLEALRFYANTHNYHWNSKKNYHFIEEDEGMRAREAIRKATGE